MNLRELLDTYSVPYKLPGEHTHATWGRLQINCPHCDLGSSKFHMGIHEEKLYANCWKCGSHPILKVLAEITKESYHVLKGLLDGLDLVQQEVRKRGTLIVPIGVEIMKWQHRDYLHRRGIDPDEAEQVWGVKGLGFTPKLSWRLWIPMIVRGETVSWTTRSIVEDVEHRYINARPSEEAISLKECLFGIDHVHHSVIVTEGPIDAMRIGPGAVAVFGTAYSQQQAILISRYPVRVICFDNEPAAQARAWRLGKTLGDFPGEPTRSIYLTAKDPGSAEDWEIEKIRREYLK